MDDWNQFSLFDDSPEEEQNPLMTLDEMREHEWYVSWSGGKDSTATIILMHENNIPIKKITYVRMMWDETIPATLPIMTEFVDRLAEVFRSWGYQVDIVPSVKTAKWFAYKPVMNPKRYDNRKGKPVGILKFSRGSCDFTGVKIETIRKNQVKGAYEMIGYAADEIPRIKRLGGKKQSILVALNIIEDDCFGICEKYGVLSPLYGLGTSRDGCWFCPNARKAEREKLKRERPDLYAEIIKMIETTIDTIGYPTYTNINGWLEDFLLEIALKDQYTLF